MNLLTENGERVRNFYRKQGADAERERIIKLLENLADITTNHQHKLGVLEAVACIKFTANHTALIKGENK